MKIEFLGLAPVSDDELMFNVRSSKSRGYPEIQEKEAHGRTLAVVGGGPSIVDSLKELSEFDDVWAINGACGFLRSYGIDSTLLTIDPVDFLKPRVAGAKKALLATRCHPGVFDVLRGADIQVFDVNTDSDKGLWASVSTATVVFHLATLLGYRKTVFFGCEGSFSNKTHAYMDEAELQGYRFVVECNGKRFDTAPDLYLLTKVMADLLRLTTDAFTERSGGMLRAFIECEEHEIVDVSPALAASLKPVPCKSCGQSVGHYDDCEVGMGVF